MKRRKNVARENLLKRMQSGGIVALKPGQHFDPLGDALRVLGERFVDGKPLEGSTAEDDVKIRRWRLQRERVVALLKWKDDSK